MKQMVEFLGEIRNAQNNIEQYLCIADEGHTVYTNNGQQLSLGCQCCKAGTWMCIYLGYLCNAKCKYCAQGSIYDKQAIQEDKNATQKMPIEQLKQTILGQQTKIRGLSYTGGEPLMYTDKLKEIMSFVQANNLDVYQWMYTNGLLITENQLLLLKNLGLNEIRFHWGSTDFSNEMLEKMRLAKKHIAHVNIETPATVDTVQHLVSLEKLKKLEEIGIEQINLGEVAITCDFNAYHMGKSTNYRYATKHFCTISPLFSRRATYDIIQYAAIHTPNIIINDCSNEAKSWQQQKVKENGIVYFG